MLTFLLPLQPLSRHQVGSLLRIASSQQPLALKPEPSISSVSLIQMGGGLSRQTQLESNEKNKFMDANEMGRARERERNGARTFTTRVSQDQIGKRDFPLHNLQFEIRLCL